MQAGEEEQGPLAILPGLLCDSRMFAGLLTAFPPSVPVDGFYGGAARIEEMADYALERLPGRFALLGHSMGARVALEIMRREPQRVTRLALVDTGTHVLRPGEREKRHALRDLGRERGMEALVDMWLPPMLGASSRDDGALYDRLRAMSVSAGLPVFEAQIEALLNRPSVDALLGKITCPTFAIVGEEDEWSPVAQHEAIAAAIAGAELRIVPGAGHMLPAERPEAFSGVIAEWLCWQPSHMVVVQ